MKYAFCIVTIVLAAIFSVPAQTFNTRHYSVEDGLSHANVFRVFQDKKGFVWLSTNYGLCSFNGAFFTSYTTAEGLSHNAVLSVSERRDGSLLLSTMAGVDRFHRDSIKPLMAKGERVLAAIEEGERTWILTVRKKEGYELLCEEHGTMRQVTIPGRKTVLHINNMLHLRSGGMLFAAADGLYRSDGSVIKPFAAAALHSEVQDIQEDDNGRYWVALSDKLLYMDSSTVIWSYAFSENAKVSNMHRDSKGRLWLYVSGKGVFMVSDFTVNDMTDRLGIGRITVNDIFEDAAQHMWFATHGEGLYMLPPGNTFEFRPGQSPLNLYTTAMSEFSGSIIAGSMGSLCLLKGDSLQAIPMKHLDAADYIYTAKYCSVGLCTGIPRGMIIRSADGHEHFIRDILGVLAIHEDRQGNIWLGHFKGLSILKDNRFVRMSHPAINNRRINSIIEGDTPQSLLLATDSGLYCLNGTDCRRCMDKPILVRQVLRDSRDRVWLATEQGLMLKQGRRWLCYTEAQGLRHSKCNALAEDCYGNIWVGTLRGCDVVDGTNLQVTLRPAAPYNTREVLSLLGDGDAMYMGTVSGITRVQVQADPQLLLPPPTYITSVQSAAGIIAWPQELILSSGDKKFSVAFIGISYSSPVEYAYRIEGYDSNWHISREHAVQISALPPGRYIFCVKARILGGSWGSEVRLPVFKDKAYWQSTWFYLLLIAIAAAIIYLSLRYYIQRHQRKVRATLEISNKMVFLEQQALAAQINPHFIFNCLNSIQYFVNRNHSDLANTYLSGFARLIRMTLEYSQESYIALGRELKRLEAYLQLEKLRCGDMLSYTISVDPAINCDAVHIPNMIIQPYIENAIWHGIIPMHRPGTVELHVNILPSGGTKISVKDDGVGFYTEKAQTDAAAENEHGQSFGMTIIEQRLKLLNTLENTRYSVSVTDRMQAEAIRGTCIEILIPA